MNGLVILGAGQAAVQLVMSLRASGDDRPIALIGEEPFAPYARPPLSKGFLKGDTQEEDLCFRPLSWFADNGVSLHLGQRALRIDRRLRRVVLADAVIPYQTLVFATGATPRALPQLPATLANVVALRGIDDIRKIRRLLPGSRNIAVIGGGFIGLELAAALRDAGRDVTVIEAGNRVLGRAVSPVMSDWFAALHQSKGVKLLLDTKVTGASLHDDRVCAIGLSDGTHLGVDMVIVGVGAAPNDVLAREAGLICDDGISVDGLLRTSDPAIFAIGDCARFPLPDGRTVRHESVQNAVDQGKHLARVLGGEHAAYQATPWFWSDQFEVKLQIAGLLPETVGADLPPQTPPGFSLDHYLDGRLMCRESVNDFRAHLKARKEISAA